MAELAGSPYSSCSGPLRVPVCAHEASLTLDPVDQLGILQLGQRPLRGDPADVVFLRNLGFGRKLISSLELPDSILAIKAFTIC